MGNVAQAMLQDALTFHNKADGGGEQQQEGESSATTANVLIADNSRINALCQVNIMTCTNTAIGIQNIALYNDAGVSITLCCQSTPVYGTV